MPEKTLLGAQVKHMLSGLSDHGVQQLAEVENDLVQTNVLLGEAIEKLATSFLAIHEAARVQQTAVDRLLAGDASSRDTRQLLQQKQAEMERHVGAAVTGLQFQDMTNQLIERMKRRVSGLREVLSAAGSKGVAIAPESDPDGIAGLVQGINRMLDDQNARLENELRRSVAQTHMESGDIELF